MRIAWFGTPVYVDGVKVGDVPPDLKGGPYRGEQLVVCGHDWGSGPAKFRVRGKVDGCSLQMFEDATGLKLMDDTGIKDELPPITTFLNRLLALTIELQGILFTAFEQLLNARIEGAIASGSYDVGLETLRAESFVVTDRQTIHVHPATGAEAIDIAQLSGSEGALSCRIVAHRHDGARVAARFDPLWRDFL